MLPHSFSIYIQNKVPLFPPNRMLFVLNSTELFKYTHELRYADNPNPSFVPIKILQSHTLCLLR